MWEWFISKSERQNYVSQIMEGPHGGGGAPLEPKVIGWLWGFLIGGVTVSVIVLTLILLGKL